MHRHTAAVGSTVFFVLTPGVVAGLVPWWLTGWEIREPLTHYGPVRVVGVAVLVLGAVALVQTFARFVVEGIGTPAPIAPTQHLVVGGLYRYVRNPMYLAVLAVIVGQSLVIGQPMLLAYAAAVWVTVALFVHGYEEPTLRQQFGARYDAYRAAVPAWRPRARPWR
jgi:protein-S-isoprenylcysteine O-methyltransferase Ste14